MQSTWQALIWKEWRDMRWKVAALIVIAVAILVGSVCITGVRLADPADYGVVVAVVMGLAASAFLGMGAAAGEQSAGTIGLLQAFPVSPRRAAIVKLIAAIASIAVIIFVALSIAFLQEWLRTIWYGDRFDYRYAAGAVIGEWQPLDRRFAYFLTYGGLALVACVSVLLWGIAIGVNACDEIRAAAIGFVTIVLAWGSFGLVVYLSHEDPNRTPFWRAILGCMPGGAGIAMGALLDTHRLPSLGACLELCPGAIVHTGLAWWYVTRFGRVVPARLQTVERVQPAVVAITRKGDWLAPPRRGPLASLVWKQFRESGPLAMLGGALIAGVCVVIAVAVKLRRFDLNPGQGDILGLAGGIWAMVGYAIALVAGIGVFMDDLRPELQGFWRSRPIRVGQWFAVKLLAGLGVTIGFLILGLLASVVIAELLAPGKVFAKIGREELAAAAAILGVHVGVYLAAVALMAWLRHPVYAGVLATPSPWVAAFAWAGVAKLLASAFPSIPEPAGAAAVTAIFAAIAVGTFTPLIAAAWLAVKHDWGWKH